MAAHREFSWPPARSLVSAYKENLMAADIIQNQKLLDIGAGLTHEIVLVHTNGR